MGLAPTADKIEASARPDHELADSHAEAQASSMASDREWSLPAAADERVLVEREVLEGASIRGSDWSQT